MGLLSTPKLIAIVIAGIVVLAVMFHVKGRMDLADELVAATRTAVANPDLKESDAADQILALGSDRDELLRTQAQLRAEAVRTKAQRDEAVKASQIAQERVRDFSGASAQLEASALAGGPTAADCVPSKTARELWR